MEVMLGFDRTPWHPCEKECPDLLMFVHNSRQPLKVLDLPPEIVTSFSSLTFSGTPNLLSKDHADWKIIEEVSSASEKSRSPALGSNFGVHEYLERDTALQSAAAIIRQRRSAQVFDAVTAASRDVFFAILDKTMPRQYCAPFDPGLGDISVHLAIFVHRVTGLQQGLYVLVRDGNDLSELKLKCRKDFLWQKAEGAPDTLGIYLLEQGDYREIAASVSCYQEIAGDGTFSLGMLAKFRKIIEKDSWLYRKLFWETGMIGQVLYLEAEAYGLRGTGIGCFFDDMMHSLLGLNDDSYQSLYHFTIGSPIEDKRLTTLPPYHHLKSQSGKKQ
jgi:nitroreductase